MDTEDKIGMTIAIVSAILLVGFIGAMVGSDIVAIKLSQETADDVCQQLTNNSAAVASDDVGTAIGEGKLICSIPTSSEEIGRAHV